MKLFVCIVVSLFAFNDAAQRKLSYGMKCRSIVDPRPLNLVHVEALGEDDTIHYIWSTYKIPSVIIARTANNATLDVDCDGLSKFQPKSIAFSEVPFQSLSFVLNMIYEFEDKSDKADMDKANSISPIDITDLEWNDANETMKLSETFISSSLESWMNASLFSSNGTIKTQFSVAADGAASPDYPHLHFTSKSLQLQLLLSNLNPSKEKSRFAVEMVAVSSGIHGETWHQNTVTSINDEYSPGVFKVIKMNSECSSGEENCKNFAQWKPVAYIGEKPTVANSTDARMSVFDIDAALPLNSIVAAFHGDGAKFSTVSWNLTFGSTGDGFYEKTRFTSWNVMLGLGEPVLDEMSLMATIVISVGLGAPLLIALGGVIFLIYKRLKRDDDDLLLEG